MFGGGNGPGQATRWWIDAPNGRIGQALQAVVGRCEGTSLQQSNHAVWTRIFTQQDAARACEKATNAGFSGRFTLVSSMAELPVETWHQPDLNIAEAPWPADPYGVHKRHARLWLEDNAPGPTTSLLLPALLKWREGRGAWAKLAETAIKQGVAWCPGTGAQQTSAMAVADVAQIIAGFDKLPTTVATGAWRVGPPATTTVKALVAAFLRGAELDVGIAPHPDPSWRGPLSSGSEVVAADALWAALGTMMWTDPESVCAAIGRQWRAVNQNG